MLETGILESYPWDTKINNPPQSQGLKFEQQQPCQPGGALLPHDTPIGYRGSALRLPRLQRLREFLSTSYVTQATLACLFCDVVAAY